MANALYSKGRQAFLQGDIDWLVDDIKVVLVDMADYPLFDIASDQFLSAVPAAARISTTANLTGKTTDQPAPGTADADDISFPAVSGDISEALVIYKDTADPATSPLIVFIDTAAGLPVTPNSGPIEIAWDQGDDRIFTL